MGLSGRMQFLVGTILVGVAVLFQYYQKGDFDSPISETKENFLKFIEGVSQWWIGTSSLSEPRESASHKSKPSISKGKTVRLITKEELQQHGPEGPSSPIWLSILGRVYNVDSGKQHYGKNGGYNFFAGRDGTRAFITGDFTDEGLKEDIYGLGPKECADLQSWVDGTYEMDYIFVGKLIGGFYDNNGEPTEMNLEFQHQLKLAKELDDLQKAEEKVFPPCNSRWSQTDGGWVSCSTKRSVTLHGYSIYVQHFLLDSMVDSLYTVTNVMLCFHFHGVSGYIGILMY